MDRFDFVVVGAGFSGAVCAERLAAAGRRVLVLEQRDHIGGNAYDEYDAAGVLVHRYGPHIFHTNSDRVWSYLSQFTDWRPYEHRVLAYTRGQYVPVPINRQTVAALGGVGAARAALIAPYTAKQWGEHAASLDPSVLARVPVRPESDEDRYFGDTYQAMPARGYRALFLRLLRRPGIRLLLKTSFKDARRGGLADIIARAHGVIVTGPIDAHFGYCLGRLPYRSATFAFETRKADTPVLPAPVVNYPDADVPYTRVCEYRQLTGQWAPFTTLGYETPAATGDPYWPVPTKDSAARLQAYRDLAAATAPTTHFCGRLGTYRYLNIDQAVAQALKLADRLTTQETTHALATSDHL